MVIRAVSNKTEDLLKHREYAVFTRGILKHSISVVVFNFSQSFGAAGCKIKQQSQSDKRSDIVIRLRTACEGNLNANSSSPQLLFEVVGEKFSARLEADEAVQLLNLPACELIPTRE